MYHGKYMDETPAETPLAKARLNLEQTVRLVNLLQDIERRLNLNSTAVVHLQIKFDKADPTIYNQMRAELEKETREKMNLFIEALEEAEDRPSQTIIVNPRTKHDSLKPRREKLFQLITLIVTAVAAFFMALKETGLIK